MTLTRQFLFYPLRYIGWLMCLTSSIVAPTVSLASSAGLSISRPLLQQVGDNESIPFGAVTAMTQDARGVLWIGTQNGLVSYDGYRFRKYVSSATDAHSLPGNNISTLAAAPDGRVWVGSTNDGLSFFDPQTDQFTRYVHEPENPDGLSEGGVTALLVEPNNGVWIGTSKGGLDYLAPASRVFVHHLHDPQNTTSVASNRIHSLLKDRHGALWVGSSDGLQRLRTGSKTFERIASDPMTIGSLAGQAIRILFEAADGSIWAGTRKHGAARISVDSHQLTRIQAENDPANKLSEAWIPAIAQPNPAEIWLGNFGGGISIVAAHDGRVIRTLRHDVSVPGSLAMDFASVLMLDRSGLLWVGTWGGGLQVMKARNAFVEIARHSPANPVSLSYPHVYSVLELADGRILAGTAGNGIDIIDRERGLIGGFRAQPNTPGELPSGHVVSLAQTADGAIWAGTRDSGVVRRLANTNRWDILDSRVGLPHIAVQAIHISTQGELWVGTSAGVARWSTTRKRFETFAFQDGKPFSAAVFTLASDASGRIWVGSDNGLAVWSPADNAIRLTQHDPSRADSLSNNTVLGLLVDRQGNLWVDTLRGLDQLQSWGEDDAAFFHVSEAMGRPGLYFGANLLEDELGRIWTQWFVLDVDKQSLTELNRADGLDIGSAWAGARTRLRDGQMLFGGSKGLALVSPEKFQPWQYAAPVIATSVRFDSEPQPLSVLMPKLVVPATVENFSVSFSALDYSAPQKNRYRYKLVGDDDRWHVTDAEARSASFGNLWPGSYELLVQGTDRSGNWSENELRLSIRVQPALWQTPWFVIAVVLVIGATAYCGHRWRLARVHAYAKALELAVNSKTRELQQSNANLHAANQALESYSYSVSHDLRGPLNGIIGFAGFLHEDYAASLPPAGQDFLNRIIQSADRMNLLIADLLRLAQLSNSELDMTTVDMQKLVNASWAELTERGVGDGVNFHVAALPNCQGDRRLLKQVLINLLSNAVKYSQRSSTSSIEVFAESKAAVVIYCVRDNGVGFDSANAKTLFGVFQRLHRADQFEGTGVGLAICRRIIERHGGRIWAESAVGQGATFRFTLTPES